MSNYIFDLTTISALSNKPQQAIVLCHGYGGNGQDISNLAINWQRFLPDCIFLCPNAPEICSINPNGFQWFSLESDNENLILEKSLLAEKKLSLFLDQVLETYNFTSSQLALVGFSQGCMMVIQTALKKQKKINCLLGYSGKIINQKHLSENIVSKPKILLMHGENDVIVPPTHLLESKEFLEKNNIKIKTKLFKNCEHNISIDGVSVGLDFLKKNLL
jgi:phospholipase/carboxylesterase